MNNSGKIFIPSFVNISQLVSKLKWRGTRRQHSGCICQGKEECYGEKTVYILFHTWIWNWKYTFWHNLSPTVAPVPTSVMPKLCKRCIFWSSQQQKQKETQAHEISQFTKTLVFYRISYCVALFYVSQHMGFVRQHICVCVYTHTHTHKHTFCAANNDPSYLQWVLYLNFIWNYPKCDGWVNTQTNRTDFLRNWCSLNLSVKALRLRNAAARCSV